jgi:WD40 repeat protein
MGYDLYSGVNLFSVLTHFGPVNNLAVSKTTKLLASGAEDSTVRFYPLDQYYEFMEIK